MDLGPVEAGVGQAFTQCPGRGAGLHGQDQFRDMSRDDRCVGTHRRGERSGVGRVEGEDPHSCRANMKRKGQHGSHTRLDRGAGEGRPARSGAARRQVLHHRPLAAAGVDGRALSDRELQVLQHSAHAVGGAQLATSHPGGQGDAHADPGEQVATDRTQVALPGAAAQAAREARGDPFPSFAGHHEVSTRAPVVNPGRRPTHEGGPRCPAPGAHRGWRSTRLRAASVERGPRLAPDAQRCRGRPCT